jgi:pimeloyl-ACP methyl ester carboxylesterase
MHPALLQSLVLIDPVIQQTIPPGPNAAFMTSYRPDIWPSRDEARAFFSKNKFYKSWDRRAFEKYLEYALRETPTAIFPDAPPGSVTLTTTKHQEAWSYVRSTFAPRPSDDTEMTEQERLLTSDYDSNAAKYVFTRPEAALAFKALSTLQPAVFWVFGERSYINPPKERDIKISRTGVGARGSGGVSSAIIKGAGHLIPLEKVSDTASVLAPHIEQQVERYKQQQEFWKTYDTGKSDRDKKVLSSQWMKAVRQKSDILRPVIGKTKL